MWADTLVLSHLVNRPMPRIPDELGRLWADQPTRLRECTLATVLDRVVGRRSGALRAAYAPEELTESVAGVATRLLDDPRRPSDTLPGAVWVIPQLRWLHELGRLFPRGRGVPDKRDPVPPLDYDLPGLKEPSEPLFGHRVRALRRHPLSMALESNRPIVQAAILGDDDHAGVVADLAVVGIGVDPGEGRLRRGTDASEVAGGRPRLATPVHRGLRGPIGSLAVLRHVSRRDCSGRGARGAGRVAETVSSGMHAVGMKRATATTSILLAAACAATTIAQHTARPFLPTREAARPRHAGAVDLARQAGRSDGPGRQLGRDPPADTPVCRAPKPPCGATAMVVRVVDGDTVILRTAGRRERVRLIGVDAPETWLRHDCYGEQATEALRHLTPPGSLVNTTPDVEHHDRFGRLLLYLWTPQGTFVNETLIHDGFVRIMTVPPNTVHAPTLQEAEHEAQHTRAGLWHTCL